LEGDPHRALRLSTFAFTRVVSYILGLARVPTLLVGGGGYNPPAAAKHFALLTALVVGKTLEEDIPVEAEYWEELERHGGIHVGRDEDLNLEGELQVEEMCAALKDTLGKRAKMQ
jgi:hypothetical protein